MKTYQFVFLVLAVICLGLALNPAAHGAEYVPYVFQPQVIVQPQEQPDTSTYLHSDGFGTTIGSVGDQPVYIHNDGHGNSIGSVGDQSVYCHTDNYGNTMCN